MPSMRDITGQLFGKLTARERVTVRGSDGRMRAYWKCKCKCGGKTRVSLSNLTSGNVISCGCLAHVGHIKHGHARAGKVRPEYHIWQGIKKRCTNRHATNWKDYGGRGIQVCKRWLRSFENFWKDIGPRPSLQHTLGRLNNNGNYQKSNCAWQLAEAQANNTRRNVHCTLHGITLTLTQWTRVVPVNRSVINHHYNGTHGRPVSAKRALQKAWTAERCMHWLDQDPARLSRVAAFRVRHSNLSVRDAALAVICKEYRAVRRK